MREKVVAAVLALFFGGIGIHRFYLGQISLGILYALFFWTGIPFLIGIIDAIVLLVTPQEVFDAKYNSDPHLAHRNHRRAHRANNRNQRRSKNIKKRHQPKNRHENRHTNRDLTNHAKGKIQFKKLWDKGKKALKNYQFQDAEKAFVEAMEISPNRPELLFDMACLHAMNENTNKAYEYLELAIFKGFKDYKEIESNPALAFLRIQDSYLDFAKAGYKRPTKQKEPMPELLEQLRQLDLLKSRGLLTELEYEMERKKLLY